MPKKKEHVIYTYRVKQLIVDAEPVHNGHRLTWLELLRCGHTGKSRATREAVMESMGKFQHRVCKQCTEKLIERENRLLAQQHGVKK